MKWCVFFTGGKPKAEEAELHGLSMITQLIQLEGELGLSPLPMFLITTPMVLKVWSLAHMHQNPQVCMCKKLLCSQI